MNKKYLDDKELVNIPDKDIKEFRKEWAQKETMNELSKHHYRKKIEELEKELKKVS